MKVSRAIAVGGLAAGGMFLALSGPASASDWCDDDWDDHDWHHCGYHHHCGDHWDDVYYSDDDVSYEDNDGIDLDLLNGIL
jgi:hypothetical protein